MLSGRAAAAALLRSLQIVYPHNMLASGPKEKIRELHRAAQKMADERHAAAEADFDPVRSMSGERAQAIHAALLIDWL